MNFFAGPQSWCFEPRSPLTWLWFCVFCLLGGSSSVAADDLVADRDAVRRQVAATWRGIATFQFRSTETTAGTWGDATINYQDVYDFIWGGDGRAALTLDRTERGQTERGHDFREDGRRAVQVRYFPGSTTDIDQLTIRPQASTARSYGGLMCRALWAIMPAGMTWGTLVDEGGELSQVAGRPGRYRFQTRRDRREITAEFDEQVGYWPRSVQIQSPKSSQTITIARFTRDNGIWFPAEGAATIRSEVGGQSSATTCTFRIDHLAVNQPVAAPRFAAPALPRGAQITDNAARTQRIEGGKYARTRWLAAHPRPPAPAPQLTQQPIRVPAASDGWSRPAVAALATLVLVAAIVLWFRRCHSL